MTNKNIKNVIVFDLDDTLYNEIDYLHSAFREIAEYLEANYSILNASDFMLQKYYTGQNVCDQINKNYSLNIPIEKFLLLYRNHNPEIQLDNLTENTLETLQKNDCILGMITDGREITQRNKIKALGLEKYIKQENIVISESFGSAKPSPKSYMYFQQKYNAAQFIYVGDNVSKDFIAPNQLNWVTVCLLDNGKNIHKQDFTINSEYLPQYKIENIKDLLKYVLQMV